MKEKMIVYYDTVSVSSGPPVSIAGVYTHVCVCVCVRARACVCVCGVCMMQMKV